MITTSDTIQIERGKKGTPEARKPKRGYLMGNPRYSRQRINNGSPDHKDITMGRN